MQQLAVRALHGRRVATKSGQALGTVRDVIIDADSARVIFFEVAPHLMSAATLAVSPDAIIEITPDVVVVADSLVTLASPALA